MPYFLAFETVEAMTVLEAERDNLRAENEALKAAAADSLNTIKEAFTLLGDGMELSAYRVLRSALSAAVEVE